jgi:hypothetical protein
MLQNLWRAFLIAVLSATLAVPAHAETLNAARDQIVTGIVVVSAAVAVLIIVLVLHHKRKSVITGCVSSGANGMSMTDERDKRIYVLTGESEGVKPGDRMTLDGKLKKVDKAMVFEARTVTKDFGACRP